MCSCVITCACRKGLSTQQRVLELMRLRDEAREESKRAKTRYEQAVQTLQQETSKLERGKLYAVPGGVLMVDAAGYWSVRPLENFNA